MLNFKNKILNVSKLKVTNPLEIYNTLDRKSITGPLRTVQEYILKEWFETKQKERDLIIKLHTGEGKTLIGLLILQSIINQEEGPCLYVCPNKYLVDQVCEEAIKFGIPYCTIDSTNNIPNEYLEGEKILITHAHKIFNGKSIFGINNSYIETGMVILDDAHACIEVLKNAFSIFINKDKNLELYNKILNLFSEELLDQREGSFLDICSGNEDTFMLVPYWAWFNKKNEVLKILSNSSNSDEIKFTWPLIRDNIKEYCCFISGKHIEIVPYNTNVKIFGTFARAKKRILMSATTQEDIFFIKGLDFEEKAIESPLIYSQKGWSGEKMIIFPSLINEYCDKDFIANEFTKMKLTKFGIVSVVSNNKRAQYYKSLGAIQPKDSKELLETLNNLKKGIFDKLVVLNNRYDGIDLPDESCRILIIDSIPHFNSCKDKYEEICCPNSDVINRKIAQKVEQGIGRAVRGEKDYCLIIIIGPDIAKFMQGSLTRKYFSSQTRKQIDMGVEIAKMSREEMDENTNIITPIFSLIKQVLQRDEGWKEYYSSNMSKVSDKKESFDNIIYQKYKLSLKAENLFSQGEYEKAVDEIQKIIDSYITDDLEKGWYLEQMARYAYMFSKEKSIKFQKAAFKNNSQLLKPQIEIEYSKIVALNGNRIANIKNYLKKYNNFNEFSLAIEEVLNNLSFGMPAEKFEFALKNIGEMLGYESQRPDKEIRKGPDNLWGISNKYIMFECKSEIDENRGCITKREAGQFNNHCAWFKGEYGKFVNVLYIMIIPTRKLAYEANFNERVLIIQKNKLAEFKRNIKGFIKEIKKYEWNSLSDEKIQRYLNLYKLNIEDFETNYTEEIFHLSN